VPDNTRHLHLGSPIRSYVGAGDHQSLSRALQAQLKHSLLQAKAAQPARPTPATDKVASRRQLLLDPAKKYLE